MADNRYEICLDCICPRECSCEKPPTDENREDGEHRIHAYCPEHGSDDEGALPECPAAQHWWE
jgi:hypothetical protein